MAIERTRAAVQSALRREQNLEPVAPHVDLLPAIGADDQAAAAALAAQDIAPAIQSEQFAGMTLDPDTVLLGSLVIAGSITAQTADADAQERMQLVVRESLQTLVAAVELVDVSPAGVLQRMMHDCSQSQKIMLLIELALANPFAPHQHSWRPEQRAAGLVYVERTIGAESGTALDVLTTFDDALRAHHRISLKRVGLYSLGAAAVAGSAGFLAAPMLGAALGSAAGLSGAAATSHGLALLGSVGGTQTMAAGTWLIAQAGATAGAVGGALGTSLYELGAARTQAELVKLQVAAKMILIDLQRSDHAARQVANKLGERLDEIEAVIDHESLRSDPASERVSELQSEATAFADARTWIGAHCADDEGGLEIDMASLRADLAALTEGDPRSRLDDESRSRLRRQIDARFSRTIELDRYDVIAAVTAGVVGAVIDAVVTATPTTSLITPFLRDRLSTEFGWLERRAGVPFDQSIGDGFAPINHRALTAGHDPLVGLVWGVWDILGSTMTRSTTEAGLDIVSVASDKALPTGVASAVVRELAHLASDICTPAGLPLPGWFALVTNESTAPTAVGMYTRGYDTWHLPAMTLPIAATNTLIRLYVNARTHHDPDYADVSDAVTDRRRQAMLLLADAVSCSGDIVELLATNGNPLVLNWSQWVTLAHRLARAAHASIESPTDVMIDDLRKNQ